VNVAVVVVFTRAKTMFDRRRQRLDRIKAGTPLFVAGVDETDRK
jgi:hypothetical protein